VTVTGNAAYIFETYRPIHGAP